jgi:hypothetical protein
MEVEHRHDASHGNLMKMLAGRTFIRLFFIVMIFGGFRMHEPFRIILQQFNSAKRLTSGVKTLKSGAPVGGKCALAGYRTIVLLRNYFFDL